MIKQIREYIPNEPLQFKQNDDEIEVHFISKKTIVNVKSLEDIDIDIKLGECSICHEKEPCNIRRVVCKKCKSELCINCYVQVGAQCPFCLFTYGEKFGVHMIEEGVCQILDTKT